MPCASTSLTMISRRSIIRTLRIPFNATPSIQVTEALKALYMCCYHLVDQFAISGTCETSMPSAPLSMIPHTYPEIQQMVLIVTLTMVRRPVTVELQLVSGHRLTATSELFSLIRPSPNQTSGQFSYTGDVNDCADSSRFSVRMSKDRDCGAP